MLVFSVFVSEKQPIGGQLLADGGRPREAREAHGSGALPQHRLPLHRPSRQLLRPQRPQPHLRARQDTR